MLRLFVLLLLLANGAFFAWSQGYLSSLGLAPTQQTEPQRLATQIKPEAIRLLSPTEAKRMEVLASAPPSKPLECLQSPLLDDSQANSLQAAASNLPAGSWRLEQAKESPRWIVYMGKYSSAETLTNKKNELRGINVAFENVKNTALEPGLSLGVFPTQADATTAMNNLSKRGIRTAKVVLESPEQSGQILKLPAVDDALRAQLDGIKSAIKSSAFIACKV